MSSKPSRFSKAPPAPPSSSIANLAMMSRPKRDVPQNTPREVQQVSLADCSLDTNPFTFAEFKPESEGVFMIQAACCLRNTSDEMVLTDFLQVFIAKDDGTDLFDAFETRHINTEMGPEQIITANLSTILHVHEGETVKVYGNFESEQNASFEFVRDLSTVRYYQM